MHKYSVLRVQWLFIFKIRWHRFTTIEVTQTFCGWEGISVSTICFYRKKSVWGWGNLELFSTWRNIQFLLSYQMDVFNKETRNWRLLTIGLGYNHVPWLQRCSTFSWNSPVHQNHVSSLDFSFLLFIHTVQQRHSFRIRAHIKAAFRATITTQQKNRCAINCFVCNSHEHGQSCGSAGVRKKSWRELKCCTSTVKI